MQRDFHYSLVKVIAQKTGFSPDEAQIIAFASQYVDDSFEHSLMKINGELDTTYPRFKNGYFDPICTAHSGFQLIRGLHKDMQRKVYIPFHFLPSSNYKGEGEYDYKTIPNGNLANELVENALNEIQESSGEMRVQKLIKLGVALHTFADTWAHQMFSGRYNSGDNDIENIQLKKNGSWKHISKFKQFQLNILPDIGHAEAFELPDISHLQWSYLHDKTKRTVIRDNTEIFLTAARAIYHFFRNEDDIWDELEPKFRKLLSKPTFSFEEKEEDYPTEFPEIFFNYQKDEWRSEALSAGFDDPCENAEIDQSQQTQTNQAAIQATPKTYNMLSDKKWFYFHMEAYQQREYVLNRIRRDLE